MMTPLRVLIVGESEAESRRVLHRLREGDYDPQAQRAETAAELAAALAAQAWDVLICDDQLAQFSALEALEMMRAGELDLPVIVISGEVGDERAVAVMRAGAHDFLLKDKLAGLAAAVGREVGEAEVRRLRRHATERVARQAAELTSLYATAPVGLFFLDAELRFVRVNREMEEMNGFSAEQHVGRTVRELLTPEVTNVIEPMLRQVLESGLPVLNREVKGTPPTKSDEWQRYWLVSYHPVPAGDGTQRGVHGVVMEITKRKQVEDALLASEAAERARRQELEALMDAIPAAIVISRDASNQHMTANRTAEKMLRLTRGQNPSLSAPLAERPKYQVWVGGRRLTAEELPIQRASATGVAVSGVEIEVVFPDGERKELLCSAFPIIHESGVVPGCIGAFVDITVPKRREHNLEFLAEMQKALTSISCPQEIMRRVGGQILAHLHLDHCLFVEINEAADQATVLHDHHAGDLPGLEGVYRLKDFHTDHELAEMAAGRMVVIDDVSHQPRPAENSEQFKARGIGSLEIGRAHV